MKKLLSILVMVLLGVGSVWAETYTITNYNNTIGGTNGTAANYKTGFDGYVDANGVTNKYVALTHYSYDAMQDGVYIRPSGSNASQTGYITLATTFAHTYIHSFSTYLRGSVTAGDYNPVALRFGSAPEFKKILGSWTEWTTVDITYDGTSADGVLVSTTPNASELKVYTGNPAAGTGYFNPFPNWVDGKNNYASLRNVSVEIWIPEVKMGNAQKTGKSSYGILNKPMAPSTSTEPITLTYDVSEGVNASDFTAIITMDPINGPDNQGRFSTPSITFDAAKQQVNVSFTYTSASGEGFATSYRAVLRLESANECDDSYWETIITGAAGEKKIPNELKWTLPEKLYVNSKVSSPTSSNSTATVTYTSSNTDVAEFIDGELHLNSYGQAVLSAYQPAEGQYEASNLPNCTIQVEKRTPKFDFNPKGVLYPNKAYSGYIFPYKDAENPANDNDPNNNMNPVYSSNDPLIFTVDEAGNVTTLAALATGYLHVEVEETEEWNEYRNDFPVTVERDPIHVPLCLDENLFNNNNFIVEKGSGIIVWENNALRMGTSHSTNPITISCTMHVTGSLGTLKIANITAASSVESITISQSVNNEDWQLVQELTAVASDLSYELNPTSQYIKIEFSGKQTISIHGLCITEKVGASITPDPIELVVLDDGTGGKLVMDASFTASVSNLTKLTLQLNSDDFILLRDGKTYNETDNTLLLDYTDGLGIDKNASAIVQVRYVGDDPANAVGKTCTVTAFDENGAEQAAATIQITKITTTDGAPNIIVAANAEQTGIYTGTEHDSDKHPKNGTFPYKTKQQVNVASAFADGQPLFDRLYIFGLTKNKSNQTTTTSGVQYHTITTPNATNPSPAITPCYIYDKEGSGYRLTQTIADMNPTSGTKPLPALTASGQKLYYTGYCPYASNGCAGEKGVILITGGAGAKVDVYLENLYLYARPHTQSGASKILTTDTLKMNMGLGDGNYVGLSASAFTFEATSSTPFAPTIHVRDSNKLEGGAGALHASLLTKSATAGIHSAPIHLMVSNENHAHNMTIDDKWPIHASGTVERTNGKLDLCPTSSGRPCVELGNAKSVLNFNGGQIYLKNSVPTSANYLCTFAIGHRSYTKTVSVVSATLHGLGTDRGDGTVNFNDGTINCRELSDANMNAYGGYYRSKTSMKCPQNTYINGGTFNCDIWACSEAANLGASPQNKYNNPLVSVTYPINNTPVEPYYLATIDFDALASSLICQDPTHADYGKSLADYYSGKDKYGYSSMKANADNNVTLMLPYQFTDKEFEVEETVINWATCMPTVNATAMVEGVEQTVQYGGPTTVLNSETEHTRFLFYVDIDTYTMEAAGPDVGYMTPEMFGLGSVAVAFNDGEYRNDVENETSYEVSEAQYLATPIIGGDEWFLFCPPFDITNVYVVESYSEARLKEKVEADQDRYKAQIWQAEAAVDLFFYVGYETTFNQTNANLWTIHRQWKEDGTPNKGAGAIKLTHFTGSNYDANYYLQRSSGTWGWNSETSRFVTDWEYLPATMEKVTHGDKEYNVVMKKGQIYSMKFPYKYYGYREENSANWDYWTGKYLIFEGLGPQTIEGKNYHQDIKKAMTVAAGSAEIRANNTLASMEVSGMGAYYLGENQRFWPSPTDNTSKEIYPSQGFILLNKPAVSPLPQRIASIDMMTGDVTYEPGDGSENTVTGTPTISGDRDMLVYTVAGGLGVVPVVPQHVSIYNAAGQLVVSQYLTDDTQFALPTGIYLIRGEKDQAKAMVK